MEWQWGRQMPKQRKWAFLWAKSKQQAVSVRRNGLAPQNDCQSPLPCINLNFITIFKPQNPFSPQNNNNSPSLCFPPHYPAFPPQNKFIMKVQRQRNPYLKRIFSQKPHRYSYDINNGKYYLLDEQGKTMNINPNGTFQPKFRPNYSGFVNHKKRYADAKIDPTVLHFAPDPMPSTTYHNPVNDKFAGYAQFPYKLQPQLPSYLKKSTDKPEYKRKKAQSFILTQEEKKKMSILQYTTARLAEEDNQTFFNGAWQSMTEAKPLPKHAKKTCYNYKCKHLKQWVFDEKGKLETKRADTKALDQTLGRSFYESALDREIRESKLISTMAFSGGM